MNDALLSLTATGTVIIDGALGTQLQARGLPIGACPDSWNLTQPDAVMAVAREYADAGSQVVLTNTFGANRYALERHGLADRAAEINRLGVQLTLQAVAGRALVCASTGPTGRMLAMGEVSADEVYQAFREQTEALAAAGAQAIAVETMSDLEEARIAVRAAAATGLPVVACLVFDAGKGGDRTMMGNTPEQAAEELAAAGASVIGTNCGKGPVQMLPICRRLHAAIGLPIWAKPNAGMPRLVDGAAVYEMGPSEFAATAAQLAEAGATFVGGCCGTSPAYIQQLASVLRS